MSALTLDRLERIAERAALSLRIGELRDTSTYVSEATGEVYTATRYGYDGRSLYRVICQHRGGSVEVERIARGKARRMLGKVRIDDESHTLGIYGAPDIEIWRAVAVALNAEVRV